MKHHHFSPVRRVRSLVLMLTVFGACACGSKATPPAEPASTAASPTPPPEPSAAPADEPVSAPAASSAAPEQADEVPKNCNFRVKGFCFAEQEEACAAADCPPAKCMAIESHPAKIKCAK